MRGPTRSGLPNRTGRGMSSAMPTCLSRDAGRLRTASRTPWTPAAARSGLPVLADLGVMDGHPEAIIDLDAIKSNVAALSRHVGAAQVMAVVKSDGYGHGMLPSARAVMAGGATWLGVVQTTDAIALRQAGI